MRRSRPSEGIAAPSVIDKARNALSRVRFPWVNLSRSASKRAPASYVVNAGQTASKSIQEQGQKDAATCEPFADLETITLCAASGPSQDEVVVLSDEGHAFVVNTQGTTIAQWQAHARSISSAHSQDYGSSATYALATGSRDCSVKCWDASQSCTMHIQDAHDMNVSAVCLHPSRQGLLASGSRDTSVKIWDAHGTQIARMQVARNIATCMTFSRNEDTEAGLLWQGSEDLAVRAWDWQRTPCSQSPSITLSKYVYFPTSIAVSGHMLMTGCKGFQQGEGCEVFFWDLRNTSEPLAVLGGHGQDVVSCLILKEGRTAATLSKDSTIRVWDMGADSPRALECLSIEGASPPVAMVNLGKQTGHIVTLNFSGQMRKQELAHNGQK